MATTTRRRRVTGRDFEDENEEETTPRRRRSSEAEDVEETEPVKASDEDEDEDEDEEPARPARRSRRVKATRDDVEDEGDEESAFDNSLVHKGWDEVEKNQPKGDWINGFRFSEDPQIIKFLDDEPWDFMQHWVQREGKQSFTCVGPGCPLCKIGVKVSQKIVFPIVNFGASPDSEPEIQSLIIGRRFATTLRGYHEAKTTGPLTRLYWAVSKTGKGLKTQHHALPVKERDLEEDWEFDLDAIEDFLSTAEAPDPKAAINWDSKSALRAIADEVME